MRLHGLTVTAFGPFGGTHRVDFDELSAAGLFLMHGPTGAGKTSVLDAVCFALYGSVPGARQQPGGSLRSHHAEAGTLTEVVLELTVAGRRLEITRRPEQQRPKRRGTGTTTEKAHSHLREWDVTTGNWAGLSRSHQEIGEEIAQLTGMSRDQFCQVVLLPQGDFARFLRAGAEERAALLGRLFDTGRFGEVEEDLARRRREVQEDVRAGNEKLLALAHRIRQAAGPAAPPVPLPGEEAGVPHQRTGARRSAKRAAAEPAAELGPADAVLEHAAHARSGARELLDTAACATALAEQAHEESSLRLEDVRERARRARRLADARRREAALREAAPERAEALRRLERAHAAASVAPAARLTETARAEHTRAATTERAHRAALPHDTAQDAPEALTAREHAARQELGTLEAARRAEARGEELTRELAALERRSAEDAALLREADTWLAGWETEHLRLRGLVDETHEAATRAEALAGRLAPLRRRRDAAHRRDRLQEDVRRAEDALRQARDAAAAAREHWLECKEARLRGIAAELAAQLEDGGPCSVCGSTRHPDPARAGDGHVDRGAEEEALAACRRADADRGGAETRVAALREQLTAARAESGDEEAAALDEETGRLTAGHQEARTRADEAPAAREALERAEREHERRAGERQEARSRLAARTSRREALLREQAARAEEIRGLTGGGTTTVARRTAELEQLAGALSAAAGSARTTAGARERLDEAVRSLEEAATAGGFASPGEAVDAVLDEAPRRALQQRLDAWQAEEAAVRAELAELDPSAAQQPVPDEDAARAALEAAHRRLRAASATEQAARTRVTELDGLSAEATAEVRRLAPLHRRYARTAGLAGLVAGTSADNELKMRLESYVLAARLEEVAAAASARLSVMSAGRYTLVHSARRAGTRGRSGLGLHVIDHWTGVERDTATLSGGETFAASLALALGLADVVTEEAGGTRLETLFIDEGFGSLDEETLDEVLDVLDSLRERDRCVGIVSHVVDLRRRIPARLEVVKSRTGSALRAHTAALER